MFGKTRKKTENLAALEQERKELERMQDQLHEEYRKIDELKYLLENTRREIEEKRRYEIEQNRRRDLRIVELKEKNAELTARLCRKFAVATQDWPEGRVKRAGKKLNKELANLSEGCTAWCLTCSHGEPPQKIENTNPQ